MSGIINKTGYLRGRWLKASGVFCSQRLPHSMCVAIILWAARYIHTLWMFHTSSLRYLLCFALDCSFQISLNVELNWIVDLLLEILIWNCLDWVLPCCWTLFLSMTTVWFLNSSLVYDYCLFLNSAVEYNQVFLYCEICMLFSTSGLCFWLLFLFTVRTVTLNCLWLNCLFVWPSVLRTDSLNISFHNLSFIVSAFGSWIHPSGLTGRDDWTKWVTSVPAQEV